MLKEKKILIFDGAMGTMLQKRGLKTGQMPEKLNIDNPDIIEQIHREYVLAGADVITTNTFGANELKLGSKELAGKVIYKGVDCAKKSGAKYVALDIGPTGAMLEPFGTLSFDDAYEIFLHQVKCGLSAGADCVIIETMSDLSEARAALLAVKENCNLPVFVTMSFDESGRTFLGTTPEIAAITLSSLGADCVGINCSLGPKEILPLVKEMLSVSSVPIIVQPNAGLPVVEGGETVYKILPEDFASYALEMAKLGVKAIGGCCGTTPLHIKMCSEALKNVETNTNNENSCTYLTSRTSCVKLSLDKTAIIGERINPTGKKKLKEAIKNEDFSYIINEAVTQSEAGADILDVNAGLPDIDEKYMLEKMIKEIQSVCDLPLQIDSTDCDAIERAVRIYCGKAIINSVSGKSESMEKILPIVKKYGASVVALTLDDDGIPETAEKRVKIAEKIMNKAISMGIAKEDIIVDCLVLTASTNQAMVMETLKAVSIVKNKLGLKTVLGVSNVSFGLPKREIINSAYLASAFGAGLNMPILNPLSKEYMKVVNAFKVINNEDISAEKFIKLYADEAVDKESNKGQNTSLKDLSLNEIIIKGYKNMSSQKSEDMLNEGFKPMDIVNNCFIPSLNIVGEKFNNGEMFLPQLMSSAQTVKNAFDVIREHSSSKQGENQNKIIIATVKGDIHDIGKNIVKMILENYGYFVIDLGKDVEPKVIADRAKRDNVSLVGLSALMTTTVKNMEETIRLLRKEVPKCKVMVGGAVLNEEYAKQIGADFYAKDASEASVIARDFFDKINKV